MKILRPERLPTDAQSEASLCTLPSGFVSTLKLFSALFCGSGMLVPLTFNVTVQAAAPPPWHPRLLNTPSLESKLNPPFCVSTRDWPGRRFVPPPAAHILLAQPAIHHVFAKAPCVSVTVTVVTTTASLRTGATSKETPKNNNPIDIRPKILVLIAASPLVNQNDR